MNLLEVRSSVIATIYSPVLSETKQDQDQGAIYNKLLL